MIAAWENFEGKAGKEPRKFLHIFGSFFALSLLVVGSWVLLKK